MTRTTLVVFLGAMLTATVNAQTSAVVHDLFIPWVDGDHVPTAASVVDAVSQKRPIEFYPLQYRIGGRADSNRTQP